MQVDADSPCSALLPSVAPQFPRFRLSEAATIFCQESIYTRGAQRRRATRCYDQEADKFLFIDSEDGAPVDLSSIERFAHRFLRPTSALPSSPRLSPGILVFCDSEIFVGSPSGGLEPASDDALTDPGVLVMLRGVRREEQFFWELCGGSFVSGSSGEQFASRKEIPEGRKSHFFVLLREGDSVPRVKVPDGKYLFALQRTGSGAKVEKGRVRVGSAEWSPRDIELWDFSRFVEDFDEKITSAARGSSAASLFSLFSRRK